MKQYRQHAQQNQAAKLKAYSQISCRGYAQKCQKLEFFASICSSPPRSIIVSPKELSRPVYIISV